MRILKGIECALFVAKQFLRAPFCYQRDAQLREFFANLRACQRLSDSRLKPLDLRRLVPPQMKLDFRWYDFALSFVNSYQTTRLSMMRDKERAFLALLVSLRAPHSIFEFGTGYGGTLYNLSRYAASDCKCYSLDCMQRSAYDPGIEKWLSSDAVKLFLGYSEQFDETPFLGAIDLLLVDGGHSLESVRSDTVKARRMVKPGGLIIWHDYAREFPDVCLTLNSLAREIELFHVTGTSLVVHFADKLSQLHA